ncbi:methylthioribulose-1-phosphate dehydratase-like [Clavelina lepadiformis]|uniref:methylthioribulose-1-phosphate dehydratase-like n=1 Tax=Clavelina lepadiformis TaxID=159417 RepID=UPI00404391E3
MDLDFLSVPAFKNSENLEEKIPVKRGRGRPRKQVKPMVIDGLSAGDIGSTMNADIPKKRGRGRPKKNRNFEVGGRDACVVWFGVNQSTPRRGRGRPKKQVNSNTSANFHNNTKISDKNATSLFQLPFPITTVNGTRQANSSKHERSDDDFNAKVVLVSSVKRGRGRPRKHKFSDISLNTYGDERSVSENHSNKNSLETPLKRRRGRPRKSDTEKVTIPDDENPRILVPKICQLMYNLGWATGTGGGMSIKMNDQIYMAPSGVQKEMIKKEDIFVCDENGTVIESPAASNLKMTECAPLFMNAFTLRGAGAVIHSHDHYVVLASLLFKGREFRITHQEMIKGIKKGSTNESYRYDDTLVVPIIENVLFERDLTNRMQLAMEEYPDSNAVIVRRHGIYVWGNTWQRAKSQAECYHYLFELAVKMKQHGIEPDEFPKDEHGIV